MFIKTRRGADGMGSVKGTDDLPRVAAAAAAAVSLAAGRRNLARHRPVYSHIRFPVRGGSRTRNELVSRVVKSIQTRCSVSAARSGGGSGGSSSSSNSSDQTDSVELAFGAFAE
jgi:hypothetical protein